MLESLGVSGAATALALLLVGTTWPVWQMARNGGAEPVLALLLAVYVAAGARSRHSGEVWRFIGPRVLALALLPWLHPTGAVLAIALALAALLPGGGPRGPAAALLGAAALGCLSFAAIWNLGVHGHVLAGGYTLVGGERYFGATNPLLGLTRMLANLWLLAPLPLALLADKNLYDLPPDEAANIPQVCGSLKEALEALEADHEFLLKGDVFSRDFLEMWISTKRREHDALRLRVHPYEFFLYYDV